jgi:hypothetical protein
MNTYVIGILAGFLTHFINYCIGLPASKEFSPYEIFSGYTVWLAKMRIKKLGLWKQYEEAYQNNMHQDLTKASAYTVKTEFKRLLYNAAEPFFTWERAAGMCPICSGFWVSLAVGLRFSKDFVSVTIIILISHIVIRLLNKVML